VCDDRWEGAAASQRRVGPGEPEQGGHDDSSDRLLRGLDQDVGEVVEAEADRAEEDGVDLGALLPQLVEYGAAERQFFPDAGDEGEDEVEPSHDVRINIHIGIAGNN